MVASALQSATRLRQLEEQLELLEERERSLAGLSGRLMRVQEEERRSLALELHDDPLQRVSLLGRRLAGRGLDVEHQAAEDVAIALRAVCYGLRPPMLDDLGLQAALGRLVSDVAARSDVQVTLEFDDPQAIGRTDLDLELALYRVAQEALNNVLKHAHAQRATVALAYTGNLAELRIEDDGQGASSGYSRPQSLGVVGMRERLTPWAGNVAIGPRVGGGTALVARAHLGARKARAEARFAA
jgi:signal transduction histidine kinase